MTSLKSCHVVRYKHCTVVGLVPLVVGGSVEAFLIMIAPESSRPENIVCSSHYVRYSTDYPPSPRISVDDLFSCMICLAHK